MKTVISGLLRGIAGVCKNLTKSESTLFVLLANIQSALLIPEQYLLYAEIISVSL